MDLYVAHTVSQRLRRLRKIPPELIPLGRSRTRVGWEQMLMLS